MFIITIDGQTACGKNTVGTRIAGKFGFAYIDSGLIVRTLSCFYDEMKHLPDMVDWDRYKYINEDEIYYCDQNISHKVKSEETAQIASRLGKKDDVADYIMLVLRKIASKSEGQYAGIVFTGRVGGSVIFPEAHLQFFLTASAEVRAQRRYSELSLRDTTLEYNTIFRQVVARDEGGQNSSHTMLRPSSRAIIIDTTPLTADEVFEKINNLVSAYYPRLSLS